MSFFVIMLQLIIYLEMRCTPNFQKCHFLVGYIFVFTRHALFPGSVEIIHLLAHLIFQHSGGGFLYIILPGRGVEMR